MKIVFNTNEGLKLMSPNPEFNVLMIAEKDVPAGIIFKIYDDSELPLNEPFETWVCEINESNKDGVGLTSEQFYAKYPDLKGWVVQ
jgi:hypothetical protein